MPVPDTTKVFLAKPGFLKDATPQVVPVEHFVPRGYDDITDLMRRGNYSLYSNDNWNNFKFFYDGDGNYYRTDKAVDVDDAGYIEVPYSIIRKKLQKRDYIGGTPNDARINAVRRIPGLTEKIYSRARAYGIDPNALMHRFIHEGYIDHRIGDYNRLDTIDQKDYWSKRWDEKNMSGYNDFGLDYVGEELLDGKYSLLDNTAGWTDLGTWEDEEGLDNHRTGKHAVQVNDLSSAIEMMAAGLGNRYGLVDSLYHPSDKNRGYYAVAAYREGHNSPTMKNADYVLKEYKYPDYYSKYNLTYSGGGELNNYYSGDVGSVNSFGIGGPKGASVVIPKVVTSAMKNIALRLVPKNLAVGLASTAGESYGFSPSMLRPGYLSNIGELVSDPSYSQDPGHAFLLDRKRQNDFMESLGYHMVGDLDYGRVNSAAKKLSSITGNIIPIYQRGEDEIDRSLVEPVDDNAWFMAEGLPYDQKLLHAGHYPATLYRDKSNGDLYIRAWDLNDYGQHSGSALDKVKHAILKDDVYPERKNYHGITYGRNQILSELYDYIGNPFVQRTALRKVPNNDVSGMEIDAMFNRMRSDGGKIHINPENRGKFNETKRRTGKTTEELTHSSNPLTRKRAIFAQNAAKWNHKHADGGIINRMNAAYSGDTAAMLDAIQRIKEKRNG